MIAESNVNRQVHALDGEFGKAKVSAMAQRIRAINPASCAVSEIEDFVTPENVDRCLVGASITSSTPSTRCAPRRR
jgi:tRNA A37 threonylcarbamoyladenosine dehydratase